MNPTRRQFCAAAPLAALGAAGPRPSILWISSEDNSPYLGCYGDRNATTPNLDRLAAQGTLYENAFSAFPVCAPTRSTIITGVWANSLGTGHMRSFAPIPGRIRMFPALLREAGYYCTNNAKEDYNTTTPPDVWDDSSTKATYRKRKPGQPFFHVVNFNSTHESSMFKPFDPKHDPKRAEIPPYHPDTEIFRRDRARYYDNITRLDGQAGKVLAELEADGLAEDTIVFYFSDHGGIFPRGKRFVNDSGIRVPLLVRVPEKFRALVPTDEKAGGTANRLVGFEDFAPTFLSLAGLQPPHLDVVLQPEQHLAVAHAAEQAWLEPDRPPGDAFDQRAELGRRRRMAAREGIDRHRPAFARNADQEMRREVDATGGPAGRARGMDPEDAECHRQAAPTLDHPDEVGVGEIVVGLGIARIAVPAGEQCGECAGACAGRDVAQFGRRRGQGGEMRTRRREVRPGRIDRGEQQRRLGEIGGLRVGRAETIEGRARRLGRHRTSARSHRCMMLRVGVVNTRSRTRQPAAARAPSHAASEVPR